jgi:hypothetical protein
MVRKSGGVDEVRCPVRIVLTASCLPTRLLVTVPLPNGHPATETGKIRVGHPHIGIDDAQIEHDVTSIPHDGPTHPIRRGPPPRRVSAEAGPWRTIRASPQR